ncbi:MFS transporter [Leptospira kmetyi]|uniref:MFS transporter n=1 Tax=Leptospira kmetyi TaxID=408139 RepID=A0A2M9XPV9_9LEPT|nr:MFS transporter [Leptospira kmetyi]AYV55544.1 MFS transporter [Leptospira kmetyi]EQA54562.1 transporter, major facilitator family protein [Leptospira kmetyi serovar Malaysia str. Bejo-Iso9]PJZ29372.1 MFS transporter [Leptospira kmetyi]PJZ41350.1 MFS transporter [Leptospira kmetyi]TGK16657.1 MFS transporter [Leptospira kmetyi]
MSFLQKKIITRTILVLSFVSLLTDIASEMLYPVLPIYLKEIGFSILLIGILEGVAEATAGFSKGSFGRMSDLSGKRLPFVRWGYLLSSISKPMMTFFLSPIWVFFVRTTDRLGKGIRTAARDAMLSDETDSENKGKVFGFHRSMDTFGAVLGPVSALVFLYFYPGSYKELFLLAFIPGFLAIAFTFLIRETPKPRKVGASGEEYSIFLFFKYWKLAPASYKNLCKGILFFTLFNGSDIFLLLRLKEAGMSDSLSIGAYIFYNLIYALAAYPLGVIGDKIGLKKLFLFGLIAYAVAYWSMGYGTASWILWGSFGIYGIYAASTEGVSKAWITNLVPKTETATALGTFNAFQSVCMILASSITGYLWTNWNSSVALGVSGVASLLAGFFLFFSEEVETSR